MKTIAITDHRQMEDVIRKCPYYAMGMADKEGNPYIVPMNFAWENDTAYLHSGPEESKVEMVVRHPQVCTNFREGHELVCVHRQVACSYNMRSRSVICKSKMHFIEDTNEKHRILDMLMKQYANSEHSYTRPAMRSMKIWEVKVGEVSCKSFRLRPSEIK